MHIGRRVVGMVLLGALTAAGLPGSPVGAETAVVVAAARPGATAESTSASSFEALARKLGGSVGVAWVPLGGKGKTYSYGSLRTDVAWSTAKVPVAIAVVRKDHGRLSAADAKAARAAITRSDNAAAMRLWSRLGSGRQAAKATERVLRDGGSANTTVPDHRLRAGFTPFGQTHWSLADQARFAARLPCVAGSAPIRVLMTKITSSQSWGVGGLPRHPAFKGGWGPAPNGRYPRSAVGDLRARGRIEDRPGHRVPAGRRTVRDRRREPRRPGPLGARARTRIPQRTLLIDRSRVPAVGAVERFERIGGDRTPTLRSITAPKRSTSP